MLFGKHARQTERQRVAKSIRALGRLKPTSKVMRVEAIAGDLKTIANRRNTVGVNQIVDERIRPISRSFEAIVPIDDDTIREPIRCSDDEGDTGSDVGNRGTSFGGVGVSGQVERSQTVRFDSGSTFAVHDKLSVSEDGKATISVRQADDRSVSHLDHTAEIAHEKVKSCTSIHSDVAERDEGVVRDFVDAREEVRDGGIIGSGCASSSRKGCRTCEV